MWPMIVTAAASAVYSAVSSSNQAKSNAKNTRAAALANSRAATQAAIANRNASYAIANANIAIAASQANFANQANWIVAQRNQRLIEAQTEYSQLLLDREEDLLWDQLELDVKQREKIRDSDVGAYEAEVSASGIVIGEGSTANVAEHIITEADFDTMVMRHNADIAATDILNARARSEWEGMMAVQQAMWDGATNSASSTLSALSSAAGIGAQTTINSSAAMTQTYLNNWSSMYNANLQASQYDQASNQALVSGLFQVGSAIASNYRATDSSSLAVSSQPTTRSTGQYIYPY